MIRGPVALASCRAAFGLDTDLPLLDGALRSHDVPSRIVAWDDSIDWAQFSMVVVRSTWDYHRRHGEFMAWVQAVSAVTDLANSAEILAWNTDKTYLTGVADAGIPTVPTTFVAPGEHLDPTTIDDLCTVGDVVVKPTISAGSNDTERHGDSAQVLNHVRALHRSGRTAMVQPYLQDVETASETGLVYIDGWFSHAFAKGAMLRDPKTMADGMYAEERIDARRTSPDERDLGERVMAHVTERFGRPLYARVDLVPSSTGPVVIEIEMTEPSLYLHLGDGAADRLAETIRRRVA